MDLDPSNNAYDEQDLIVTVATNNQYGYKLYVSNTGSTTDLVNVGDSTKTIPNLSSGSYPTAASFPANNWGYRLTPNAASSSGNYSTFTPGVINSSTVAVNNVNTTLGFGAKIDYETASGLYKLGLEFKALPSVTTNYIQNLDPQLCTEEPLVVIDSRDEQPYTVKRLKDGNCWMTTNLNLKHATDDLTATDTNIAAGTTLSAATFNGWKTTEGHALFESGEFIPLAGTDSTSDTPNGTLYNYCAATAGTYCYADNAAVGDAGQDLCPAGWRLPTDGSGASEYQKLIDEYPTWAAITSPILNGGAAFAISGWFNDTPVQAQGERGLYWSSTRGNGRSINTLDLILNPITISHNVLSYRSFGRSIRCIRKDTRTILDDSIKYMQDVNHDIMHNTSHGTTKKLIDIRDNKEYNVVKINAAAYEALYMTDNLRYMQNTSNPNYTNFSLDYTTTDVPNTYTPSSPLTFRVYDLQTYGSNNCYGSYGGDSNPSASTGAGYTTPCMHSSSNDSFGAWYNYAAATANQVTNAGGSSTWIAPTRSICPKGWTIPNNFTERYYPDLYKPVLGGDWSNGSNQSTNYASWWSTSQNSSTITTSWVNTLEWVDTAPSTMPVARSHRYTGLYLRCILR